MKKIIVIFKTHLDIGFTDFAANVVNQYMESYLPASIRLAKEMRGEQGRFIWTTGSWLIERYLREGKNPELLEDAIRHGDIRWHGLPFTTHSELMDEELFAYGLDISRKLDARFGLHTIAAKMTDVPGHTKAIIAPLCRAGICFLHIGVNPASTPPKVPNLFRWRDSEGNEIVVMYHKDYGEMSLIGNSDTAVYFAHTGDNRGPQSAEDIRKLYRKLHEEYPEAEIAAGTLEEVAKIAIDQELPVVTEEIGDTWIHGTGTDPKRISQYRALLRLKNQLPKEEMQLLYRNLLCVPEHTWGLDEKVHLGKLLENGEALGEHRYFTKKEFIKVRGTEKFQKMEQSWEEQRKYVTDALDSLPPDTRKIAEDAIQEYKRSETDTTGWKEKTPGENFWMGVHLIRVAPNGKIELSGGSIGFLYEVYSNDEYERFRSQYVTSDESWAVEDFGKLGLEKAIDHYHSYEPCNPKVYISENQLVIKMKLPEEAVALYGGMRQMEMRAEFEKKKIKFDFAWFGKEANRIPEASWIVFSTNDRIDSIQKMSEDICPDQVVSCGSRRMHAVNEVHMERAIFRTLDAPLINIGEPGLLNFTDEKPELNRGFCLNLHNNVWGTNFSMWYEEDARFRFELVATDSEKERSIDAV